MPKPEGFTRELFKSKNGFNPYAAGRAPKGVETRERGFCFAMTCRWIKLAMQHGIEGSGRVMDGRELLHISIVQSGYLSSLPTSNTGTTDRGKLEKIVYSQSGLKRIWEKKFPEFAKTPPPSRSDFNFFEVGLPGHSVGHDFSLATKQAFYFDPNYGLYEYSMSNMKGMFGHWNSYCSGPTEFSAVNVSLCESS